MRRRTLLTLAVVVAALIPAGGLGISVAPHALFMSEDRRTAELTLFNGGQAPEEVDIEFLFGYPQATPEGRMEVPLTDAPAAGEPSAHGWLRAFPRRIRVEPGQRRVVRLQADPPDSLPEGEFWSRVIVSSQVVRDGLSGPDTAAALGLNFVFRNVLSLNYRNGAVETGLVMDSAWVQPTTDSTMVWVDLRRTGSAAFLGSVVFELYRAGEEEPVWDTSPAALAVYRSLRRYYALDLSGVEPGDYRLRVRITTERTDIPQAVVLPAAPVERVLPLRLPPRPAGRPAPR